MKFESLERQAYSSYRAYCHLLKEEPLSFEAWRRHSQRIFGTSLNFRPRQATATAAWDSEALA